MERDREKKTCFFLLLFCVKSNSKTFSALMNSWWFSGGWEKVRRRERSLVGRSNRGKERGSERKKKTRFFLSKFVHNIFFSSLPSRLTRESKQHTPTRPPPRRKHPGAHTRGLAHVLSLYRLVVGESVGGAWRARKTRRKREEGRRSDRARSSFGRR